MRGRGRAAPPTGRRRRIAPTAGRPLRASPLLKHSAPTKGSEPKSKRRPAKKALVASALRTVKLETQGLLALDQLLKGDLADPFFAAVERISTAPGRVIVSGMGKSGHVARKIAATLASTGTPAYFVHPSEASHGDLGMVTTADVILALSWSGETVELKSLITYSGRFKVPLIAVTSKADSALAKAAEIALVLPKTAEACPHGLAPTTSTTMQLVLGDALAVALLEGKRFTAADFKIYHPGGQLGANLKFVSDLMHKGERVPLAGEGVAMSEALVTMTEKSFGCLGVVDRRGRLAGIITDGDLRRHMSRGLLKLKTADIMTRGPKAVPPDMLASAVLEVLNTSKITSVFVVDKGKPVGIVHVHDLLRAGVV
ncbi:MAG: KpsF/GutQ family sugar-phosphate isomerase [Hyphomicrobiaceae bacterium]